MTKEQAQLIRRSAAHWRIKAADVTDPNLRLVLNTLIAEAERDAIEDYYLTPNADTFDNWLTWYISDTDPEEWFGIDDAFIMRAHMWFRAQGLRTSMARRYG